MYTKQGRARLSLQLAVLCLVVILMTRLEITTTKPQRRNHSPADRGRRGRLQWAESRIKMVSLSLWLPLVALGLDIDW